MLRFPLRGTAIILVSALLLNSSGAEIMAPIGAPMGARAGAPMCNNLTTQALANLSGLSSHRGYTEHSSVRLIKMLALGAWLASSLAAQPLGHLASLKAQPNYSLFTHGSPVGAVLFAILSVLTILWGLPQMTGRRRKNIPTSGVVSSRFVDDGGILEPLPTRLDVQELWTALFKNLRITLPDSESLEARQIVLSTVDEFLRGHSLLWVYSFTRLFEKQDIPKSPTGEGTVDNDRYRQSIVDVLGTRIEDQAAIEALDGSYPSTLLELYRAAAQVRHQINILLRGYAARPLVLWWTNGTTMKLYIRVFGMPDPTLDEKLIRFSASHNLFPWKVFKGVTEEVEGYEFTLIRPISLPKLRLSRPISNSGILSRLPPYVPWVWVGMLALLLVPGPWPVNAITRVGIWAATWLTSTLVGMCDSRPFREIPVWILAHSGTTLADTLARSSRSRQDLVSPPWQERDTSGRIKLLSPAWIKSILTGLLLMPAFLALTWTTGTHLLPPLEQTMMLVRLGVALGLYVIGVFLVLGPWGWLLSVQPSYQARHPEFRKILRVAAHLRFLATLFLLTAPLLMLAVLFLTLLHAYAGISVASLWSIGVGAALMLGGIFIPEPEPGFSRAAELFKGSSIAEFDARAFGRLAESEPLPDDVRLLADQKLAVLAGRLQELGLGFLTRKSVAYTRTKISQDIVDHLYESRGIIKSRAVPGGTVDELEIFVPDFPEREMGLMLENLEDGVHLLEHLEGFLMHRPRDVARELGKKNAINMIDSLLKMGRAYQVPRDQTTLVQDMRTGVLHQIGMLIWRNVVRKATEANDEEALSFLVWWQSHVHTINQAPGIIRHRHFLHALADPAFDILGHIFADKYTLFVDPESIWRVLGDYLSQEEHADFMRLVVFLQKGYVRDGSAFFVPHSHPTQATERAA